MTFTRRTTSQCSTEAQRLASSKEWTMEISPMTVIMLFFGGVYVALGAGSFVGFGAWLIGMSILIEMGADR
jgi:nicotinamide riboside transporter PnuC